MPISDAPIIEYGKDSSAGIASAQIVPSPMTGSMPESPLSFGQRSLLSIKMTPQGKVGYLESVFGKGNARHDGTDTFVRLNDKWIKTDEDAVTLSDLADWVGGVVEATPEIVAGVATRNPAIMATAGGVGAAARQALSGLIPGEEEMGLLERGKHIITNAAVAGVSQKAVNMLSPGFSAVKGAASQSDEYAKIGREASEKTGIDLSVAQTTGKTTDELLEASLANSLYVGEKFTKFSQAQSQQAYNHLRALSDDLVRGGVDPTVVGSKLITNLDDGIKALNNARKAQWASDISNLKSIAGEGRIFGIDPFKSKVTEWIGKLDIPGGPPEARKLASELKDVLKDLSNYKTVSADHMIGLMSNWSGKSIAGAGDVGLQQKVAAELMGALDQSLDNVLVPLSDNAATALRTARENYKFGSEAIRQARNLPLAKLKMTDPDTALDMLFRMKRTTVSNHLDLIAKADPNFAKEIKAAFLERSIQESARKSIGKETMIQAGGEVSAFSKKKWLNFVLGKGDFWKASFSPQEAGDIGYTITALQRATENDFMKGSRTSPLRIAYDHLKSRFTITGLPKAIAESGTLYVNERALADMLLDSGGRNAIRAVAMAPGMTSKVVQSLQYIAFVAGSENAEDFERRFGFQ